MRLIGKDSIQIKMEEAMVLFIDKFSEQEPYCDPYYNNTEKAILGFLFCYCILVNKEILDRCANEKDYDCTLDIIQKIKDMDLKNYKNMVNSVFRHEVPVYEDYPFSSIIIDYGIRSLIVHDKTLSDLLIKIKEKTLWQN